MKIVLINKSDSTGGAAVVSRRLMEALRAEGVDARMLVVEKLSDSPYVELAASGREIKRHFLMERLKIFIANGLDRSTLFKIDTASDGLPLWNHPLVKEADAILLNWVNQGMLSLKGVGKILRLGKPVVWTMHDMWCMTGICHHAGECRRYTAECGECPLLGRMKGENDISRKTWLRKKRLGRMAEKIKYVAVSNWLTGKAQQSSLLKNQSVTVIPNAFHIPDDLRESRRDEGVSKFKECRDMPLACSDTHSILNATSQSDGLTFDTSSMNGGKFTILFGAARLDDPVKNLPALVEMTKVLSRDYPQLASRLELVTFGNVKNPASLEGIALPHRHLGMVKGDDAVRKVYENADILVSSSSYETLPGTLVEAQAYGCVPVSFNQGGQSDIVDHKVTGYIAEYSDDPVEGGRRLAEGIEWAVDAISEKAAALTGKALTHTEQASALSVKEGAISGKEELLRAMRENVERRFSARSVAQAYLRLIAEK